MLLKDFSGLEKSGTDFLSEVLLLQFRVGEFYSIL
jgi:hypothetical protein